MKKTLLKSVAIAVLIAGFSKPAISKPRPNPGPQGNSGPIYFAHVFGSTVAVSLNPSTPHSSYGSLFKQAPYAKYVEFPWDPSGWPASINGFDIYDASGHLGRFTAAKSRIGVFSEEGPSSPLLPLEPATAKRAPSQWDPIAAVPADSGLSCKHFELRQETTVPKAVVDAVIARAQGVETVQPLSAAEAKIISWTTAKGLRIVAAKWDWQNQSNRLVMTALVDDQNRFADLYPFEKKAGDGIEDRIPYFGLTCQIESGKQIDLLIFAKRLYEGAVFESIELANNGQTFSRSSYQGL